MLEPIGLLHGADALLAVTSGAALWLRGGPSAFLFVRDADAPDEAVSAVAAPAAWADALGRITAPVPPWAGLVAGPAIMGILNVTPDSFSDGGVTLDSRVAIEAGFAMRDAGAAVVDVGGESTRPVHARPVTPGEEQARILPVIEALAAGGVVVSVDTRNAATMDAALAAGARIVNDVSGLTHDPAAAAVIARRQCPVILMHMRGTPETMHTHTEYIDVARYVARELAARLSAAMAAGICETQIALDPGIGFAKTAGQNITVLNRLTILAGFGRPVVVGVSRKRFVRSLGRASVPAESDPGSIAAGLYALGRNAAILRVHDVPGTAQALRVWQGLAECTTRLEDSAW